MTRTLSAAGIVLSVALSSGIEPTKAAPSNSVLHVGISKSAIATTEASAVSTLQNTIKSETGLENTVRAQFEWRTLAEKLANKDLQIGVFQGFEFAWAQ